MPLPPLSRRLLSPLLMMPAVLKLVQTVACVESLPTEFLHVNINSVTQQTATASVFVLFYFLVLFYYFRLYFVLICLMM